ncbi:MAG: Flp family type IVb pilin [Desulfobacteraceae bacterium]|nr:MAG: Flp family type IVb pilin [Desulfobacteraceae bacterium]
MASKEEKMIKNFNDWMLKTYVGKRENFRQSIDQVLGNERGAGAVEYGLIIAVVVAMVVAAATVMSDPLKKFFEAAVKQIMSFMGSKKY